MPLHCVGERRSPNQLSEDEEEEPGECTSIWQEATDSILLHVFSFLREHDLGLVAQTCKVWNRITYDESLWRNLVRESLKLSDSYPLAAGKTSWRQELKRLRHHTPVILTETLTDHTDEVLHVSFSHDGNLFSTTSKDATLKVWTAGYPTSLKYTKDFRELLGWDFTQFSCFNESDTMILVSSVKTADYMDRRGYMAILSLVRDFEILRVVTMDPSQLFGAWLDDTTFLGGSLEISLDRFATTVHIEAYEVPEIYSPVPQPSPTPVVEESSGRPLFTFSSETASLIKFLTVAGVVPRNSIEDHTCRSDTTGSRGTSPLTSLCPSTHSPSHSYASCSDVSEAGTSSCTMETVPTVMESDKLVPISKLTDKHRIDPIDKFILNKEKGMYANYVESNNTNRSTPSSSAASLSKQHDVDNAELDKEQPVTCANCGERICDSLTVFGATNVCANCSSSTSSLNHPDCEIVDGVENDLTKPDTMLLSCEDRLDVTDAEVEVKMEYEVNQECNKPQRPQTLSSLESNYKNHVRMAGTIDKNILVVNESCDTDNDGLIINCKETGVLPTNKTNRLNRIKESLKNLIFVTGEFAVALHQLGFKNVTPYTKEAVLARGITPMDEDNPEGFMVVNFSNNDIHMVRRQQETDKPDSLIDLYGHVTGLCLTIDQRYLFINCRPWIGDIDRTDPWVTPDLSPNIEVRIIDLLTLKDLGVRYVGHKGYSPSNMCCFVFLDVSKDYVASGSEDAKGYLWDRHYQSLLGNYNHALGVVNAVGFNPNNQEYLVTVSDDGTVKIWRSRHEVNRLQIPLSDE